MALTYFHDVDFPLPIREGLRLRLRTRTTVLQTRSGIEQRRCDWFDPLWEADVDPLVKTQADFDMLVAFWRARKGASFRFRNPVDSEAEQVLFATGDGTTVTFQLLQGYTSQLAGDTHIAYKPLHLIARVDEVLANNVLQATSAYSVNMATGTITFNAAPLNGHELRWSGVFDTPMRFTATEMPTQLPEVGRFAATFQLLEDRGRPASSNYTTESTLPTTTTARLPLDMAEGSSFGPLHRILTLTGDNEVTERIDTNAGSRALGTIAYTTQPLRDIQQIMRFFYARRGKYATFSMRDPSDYFTRGEVALGTGTGSATVFNLRNAYTSGGVTEYRRIYRPVQGTVHVYLDNVEATSGFSVDYSVGTVTFTIAPSLGVVVSASCEFDDLARFESDDLEIVYDAVGILSISPIDVVAVNGESLTMAYLEGAQQGRSVLPAYGCGITAVVPAAPVPKAARFDGDGILITSPQAYVPNGFGYDIINRTPSTTLDGYTAITVAFVVDTFEAGLVFDIGGPEDEEFNPIYGGQYIPLARVGFSDSSSGLLVWGDAGRSVANAINTLGIFGRAGTGSLRQEILGDPCDEADRSYIWNSALSSDCVAVVPGKESPDGLGTTASGVINTVAVVVATINLWTKKLYVSGSLQGTKVWVRNPDTDVWFEKFKINVDDGCFVVEETPTGTWVNDPAVTYQRKTFCIGGSPSIDGAGFDASGVFDLYEFMLYTHRFGGQYEAYISSVHQELCAYFYRKYALGVLTSVTLPDLYSWLDIADVDVTPGNNIEEWTPHAGVQGSRFLPDASGLNFRPTVVAKAAKPTLPAGKELTTYDGITPYSITVTTEQDA